MHVQCMSINENNSCMYHNLSEFRWIDADGNICMTFQNSQLLRHSKNVQQLFDGMYAMKTTIMTLQLRLNVNPFALWDTSLFQKWMYIQKIPFECIISWMIFFSRLLVLLYNSIKFLLITFYHGNHLKAHVIFTKMVILSFGCNINTHTHKMLWLWLIILNAKLNSVAKALGNISSLVFFWFLNLTLHIC